jgi:hypothetical protein
VLTNIQKVTAWQTQDGSLFTDKEKAIEYDVEYAKKIESNDDNPKIENK